MTCLLYGWKVTFTFSAAVCGGKLLPAVKEKNRDMRCSEFSVGYGACVFLLYRGKYQQKYLAGREGRR
jgi:hypothetical protein